MELSAGIINFIHAEGRNKIVFCREPMDGLKFINVGRELSLLIKDAGEDNHQTELSDC